MNRVKFGIVAGLAFGILLSLPDAIITDTAVPILASGVIGGLIIGAILGRVERKPTAMNAA